MSQQPAPADVHGAETLDAMAAAPRYNAWQVERLRPWIGRRILEFGSGVGNISAELARLHPEHLVLTDQDEGYRRILEGRFGGRPEVEVRALSLPAAGLAEQSAGDRLDTAIALNVVEHIEDDAGAVRSMADAVQPGGHVVILVPALQVIYGEMDRALGHFRRYDKARLGNLLRGAGLEVQKLFWFNRVGVLGWWWRGRVMGRADISHAAARAFDRLVPLLRHERLLPLPFGQSVIGVGRKPAR